MQYMDLMHPKPDGTFDAYDEADLRTCPVCSGPTVRIHTRKEMFDDGRSVHAWNDEYVSCKGKCKTVYTGMQNIQVDCVEGPTELPWDTEYTVKEKDGFPVPKHVQRRRDRAAAVEVITDDEGTSEPDPGEGDPQ